MGNKIYLYLVVQVMKSYRRGSGAILESGPFSGGVSLELARLYPGNAITIADELSEVVQYLKRETLTYGLAQT